MTGWLRKLFVPTSPTAFTRYRPPLEALEPRLAMSTFQAASANWANDNGNADDAGTFLPAAMATRTALASSVGSFARMEQIEPAHAEPLRTVQVSTTSQFRTAVNSATPGTHILLQPGVYSGGNYFANRHGTAENPIVIRAADPTQKPIFRGSGEALHFSDVSYLELRDLVVEGTTTNGINIDDAGTYDTPTHHVTLSGLVVRNVGPTGNQDGIKLSGVQDFLVENSTVQAWGSGGSGIDMVGCHNGVIRSSHFQHGDVVGANGIQAKGGTTNIHIVDNRFEHAGARAVQIGGSTGLNFFRPQPPAGYEAKDVTVEHNVFIGSQAAVAFVNVDGSTVRFNTIYRPTEWVIRILQETREEGFVPSRNGVFTDNIVAFQTGELQTAVNVGSATAPSTFQFARNWWYALNDPSRSRPSLPSAEVDGTYGIDPQFVDAPAGDLHLQPGSPAAGVGAYALDDPSPPAIQSLFASPDAVIQGEPLALTAAGVSDVDGDLVAVQFYRDANGNGTLEAGTDEALGQDTSGTDGWSLAIDSALLSVGNHTFLALAVDAGGRTSNTVAAGASVEQASIGGAVAHYRFEEASGNAALDSSGNGYHATYANQPVLGQPGALAGSTAVALNGMNEFIKLPAAPFGNPGGMSGYTISFETWLQAAPGTSGVILGQTGANATPGGGTPAGYVPAVQLGTDGKIRSSLFWHNRTSARLVSASGKSYNDGQWHHVAVTYANGMETLYLDGEAVGQQTVPNTGYASEYDYYLGTGFTKGWGAGNGGWHFFQGKLDEAVLYHRELSAAEIAQRFAAGDVGDPPPPDTQPEQQALYHFEESSGSVATDASGSGNHAAYVNQPVLGQPGIQGGSASVALNGLNQYVELPAEAFGTNLTQSVYTLSFETWFKASPGASGVILGQAGAGARPGEASPTGHVPVLHLGTEGKLRSSLFWHGSIKAQIVSPGSETYNDGEWHHVAVTYADGVETLYIDGVIAGQQTKSILRYANSYRYFLGTGYTSSWAGGNGGWHFFQGQFDETAIYGRKLTAEEVAQRYTAGGGI